MDVSAVTMMGFIAKEFSSNGCEWVKSIKQNASLRHFLTGLKFGAWAKTLIGANNSSCSVNPLQRQWSTAHRPPVQLWISTEFKKTRTRRGPLKWGIECRKAMKKIASFDQHLAVSRKWYKKDRAIVTMGRQKGHVHVRDLSNGVIFSDLEWLLQWHTIIRY